MFLPEWWCLAKIVLTPTQRIKDDEWRGTGEAIRASPVGKELEV